MTTLSVIIPTLNEEKYLPGLLRDLCSQHWKNLEIIVSDGGSTDATIRIAQEFGAKVVTGQKRGPGYGRNLGAKEAQGQLLLFLDADVRLPGPDFLGQAVEEFEARGLAAAGFYGRAWDGKWIHHLIFRLGNLTSRLLKGIDPHVAGWAILVRREFHERVGGFEEAPIFREDHIYVSRIRHHGKVGFLRAGPVLASARRFVQYGTLRTLWVYLFTELARPFGPVAYQRFSYTFGGEKAARKRRGEK
jgi:glycosyltransferase involved in cell wall biosynthesis